MPAWASRRPPPRMAQAAARRSPQGLQPPSSIVHPLHPTTNTEHSIRPQASPVKPHASPNAEPAFNPHEPSSSPELNPISISSTTTRTTSSSSARTSRTAPLPTPNAVVSSSSLASAPGPQVSSTSSTSSHASSASPQNAPGPVVGDSSSAPTLPPITSPSYQPRLGSSSGGSFQEPTSVANSSPSSNRPQTLHIALPVAIASVAVFLALGALLLLRRRRRSRMTAANQPYAAAGPDDSFGTTSTASFVSGMFGGRSAATRGIPNPFADAESPRASVDANHALESARPVSEEYSLFYHDRDNEDSSPFRDSYAAAAHHAEALEASRFAAPQLNSTPRSEAPQFVWNTDSASSLSNNAGHSTPHLAFSSADHPVPEVPPLPEMVQLGPSAFPAPSAQFTLPSSATRPPDRP